MNRVVKSLILLAQTDAIKSLRSGSQQVIFCQLQVRDSFFFSAVYISAGHSFKDGAMLFVVQSDLATSKNFVLHCTPLSMAANIIHMVAEPDHK